MRIRGEKIVSKVSLDLCLENQQWSNIRFKAANEVPKKRKLCMVLIDLEKAHD